MNKCEGKHDFILVGNLSRWKFIGHDYTECWYKQKVLCKKCGITETKKWLVKSTKEGSKTEKETGWKEVKT